MTLIFFQSCLSPHQMPFIRECTGLNGVEKVYYIIPRVDYADRQTMGWNNDRLLTDNAVECMVMPNDDKVALLMQTDSDVRCLFSGIRADADLYRWFRLSLHHDVKRYLITEPPYTFNKPLWMHYLRFYLQDYKFVKRIDGIFAIGEACAKYYLSISKRWKVFPFVYVTDSKLCVNENIRGNLKVLFVGSLSKRKNVKLLVEALKGLKDVELAIVGDGEERHCLKRLAVENDVPATFLGTKSMEDVPDIMARHDVLVLPSLHDGWGAVVNEALTQGLYAVCSDRCGAKDLLHDSRRGKVFVNDDVMALRAVIKETSDNKLAVRANREYRRKWMQEHVNGKSIAEYFVNCLTSDKEVACPWRQ